MEFVAHKTDHEFDEFHENDHCRYDVIWLEIQFFTVSPAALLDSTFNCTPEVRPHGRGYVLPALWALRHPLRSESEGTSKVELVDEMAA